MSTPTQAAKAGHTPTEQDIAFAKQMRFRASNARITDDIALDVMQYRLDETAALLLERDRLREALIDLEKALRTDSRQKDIAPDTVEYHLDGQAMYQAINKARAALKEGK